MEKDTSYLVRESRELIPASVRENPLEADSHNQPDGLPCAEEALESVRLRFPEELV